MKLGNNLISFFVIFIILNIKVLADDKIVTSPLINLEKIKPSFEEAVEENESISNSSYEFTQKQEATNSFQPSHVTLIGLDKITAKSTKIKMKLNEIKKFGPLEIRVLKCGRIENNNILADVAYLQVKDLSKNENEKVFIFNGWTFASDPNLTPFDHAIYDLWLVGCENA